MNGYRCRDKLADNLHGISNVGLSDGEIHETANDLLVARRIRQRSAIERRELVLNL